MQAENARPTPSRLMEPDGTFRTGRFELPCDDLSAVSRATGPARVLPGFLRRLWSPQPPQFLLLTVAHPRMFLTCELSRLGRVAHAAVHIVDRSSGLLYEWTLGRNARRDMRLPANIATDSCVLNAADWGSIAIEPDGARTTRRVRLDLEGGSARGPLGQRPRLHAEYHIREGAGTAIQPFVRADLLSGGRLRYTHKAVGLPAGGFADCGEIQERGDMGTAVAGLDWIVGDHPHARPRLFATGAGDGDAGQRTAFALTAYPAEATFGRADAQRIQDCVLWLRGERIPVPSVQFAHNPRRTLDPWIVRDAAGLIDLSFTPDGEWRSERRYRRHYALVVQPYGAFAGELRTPEGKRVTLANVYGAVETTRIRR